MGVHRLTPLMARFVEEYLIDLNASAAARRAGYSERNAGRIGFSLLQKDQVQAGLKKAQRRLELRTSVTQERVINELARIAFSDITELVSIENGLFRFAETGELSEDTRRAISELSETQIKGGGATRKGKLHDKVKALELLCRHLGLLVDKKEISGPGGKPLTFAQLAEEASSEGDEDDGDG